MSLDELTTQSSESKKSLAWLLPTSLIVGFILIIGLFFGGRLIPATEVEVSPVVTIRAANQEQIIIEVAKPQNKVLLFQASGWIEPDPYTVYVPTLESGIVEDVLVLEGDTVKKGDILAKLVKDDAQLDVDSAERKYMSMEKRMDSHLSGLKINLAELVANERKIEAVESRVAEAEDYLNRVNKLRSGTVSQQEVTKARLGVIEQKALLEEAKAEISRINAKNEQIEIEHEAMEAELRELETLKDRAQLSLKRTEIVSPMDGIVLKLHAAPGRKRMLDSDNLDSAVIVELYDPNKLQARIDVPLNEAAVLHVGQHVEMVSDILVDQVFKGTVTRITGEADLQRNTLQVKVAIEKPDAKLRPGMLMRAKFFSQGKNNGLSGGSNSLNRLAIYVDERALIDEQSVWVISAESTAELRKIKLSSVTKDGFRLVLDGLRSGENVILPPHGDLTEGMRVQYPISN